MELNTSTGPLIQDELAVITALISSLGDNGFYALMKVSYCNLNHCADATSIEALDEAIEDLQVTCGFGDDLESEDDQEDDEREEEAEGSIADIYDAAPSLALVVQAVQGCSLPESMKKEWFPTEAMVNTCLGEFFRRTRASALESD